MPAFEKETWEAGKVDSKTHKNQWIIFANRGTDKEKVIAEVHDVYEIIAPRRMNALLEETEANARLIAKAPEMYRTLVQVLDDTQNGQFADENELIALLNSIDNGNREFNYMYPIP